MLHRPTTAKINLENLANNVGVLKSLVEDADVFYPIIKANAYGHGDRVVASKLHELGVKQLGVSLIEEAINLRDAGVDNAIYVLGPTGAGDIEAIRDYKLIPIVSNMDSLRGLGQNLDLEIHLKFDTGMNRLGFSVDECHSISQSLQKAKNIKLTGLCTHFAKGSDPDAIADQISQFMKIGSVFNLKSYKCHVFNTDGLLTYSDRPKQNLGARVGIGLFGYSIGDQELGKKLKPVMSLCSRIVNVRSLKKGQPVSYDGTWKAQRDSQIAVIPVGYADGIPRQLSNRGHIMVKKKLVPIVGRVCMDYIMVDLTDISDLHPKVGDEVEVFGENRNLKELALEAGTITYEILTGIGPRVPRIIV